MVMNLLKICNTLGRHFLTSDSFLKKRERFLKNYKNYLCFFIGHYNFQSKVQHRLTHFLENFFDLLKILSLLNLIITNKQENLKKLKV